MFSHHPLADALIRLSTLAESADLPHLIIGGNALAHYGLPRFTRDIDFLVPKNDGDRWNSLLTQQGYQCYHAVGAFMQFEFPGQAMAPVDLMLVDAETWQKLRASARQESIHGETLAWWPAPLHLIALKLHAWRSPHRANRQQDWNDLTGLLREFHFDLEDPEVSETILRYGGEVALLELQKIDPNSSS